MKDGSITDFVGKQNGPIFITIGTAGEEFHPLYNQGPFIVQQLLKHGFLHVSISENGSKLIVSFYDNNGVEPADQFSVKKVMR